MKPSHGVECLKTKLLPPSGTEVRMCWSFSFLCGLMFSTKKRFTGKFVAYINTVLKIRAIFENMGNKGLNK
jgi:hypothetical protein